MAQVDKSSSFKIGGDLAQQKTPPVPEKEEEPSPKDQEGKESSGDTPSPTRRRRKLGALELGKLRDAIRGSVKFHDSKHDLGVIRECIEDLDIQSEAYKLKNTKPVIKFYGSYNEMLSMLLLRQGGLKGKSDPSNVLHDEFFKTNPAEFSFAETGQ